MAFACFPKAEVSVNASRHKFAMPETLNGVMVFIADRCVLAITSKMP